MTAMISNALQYRTTRRWVERFEQARTAVDAQPNLHPRARRALRDQYDSQIDELREQLAEYEALRAGKVRELELRSLKELPGALIRARIAAGLSQRELARRLGLKAQQIQRYEATRYAGVTLERAQAVADALGMELHERVILPTPDGSHAPHVPNHH